MAPLILLLNHNTQFIYKLVVLASRQHWCETTLISCTKCERRTFKILLNIIISNTSLEKRQIINIWIYIYIIELLPFKTLIIRHRHPFCLLFPSPFHFILVYGINVAANSSPYHTPRATISNMFTARPMYEHTSIHTCYTNSHHLPPQLQSPQAC